MSIFGVPDGIIEDKFPDGSEAAPAVAFLTDPDTGMYLESVGVVAISTGGTKRLRIDNVATAVLNRLQVSDGTNLSPGLSFYNSSGTGLYKEGVNTLKVACGGTPTVSMSSTGLAVTNGVVSIPGGTNTAPGVSFTGDPNTGIYSSTADAVGISAGGSPIAVFNSSGVSFTNVTGTSTGNTSGAKVVSVTISYKIVGGLKTLYVPATSWSSGSAVALTYPTLPSEIRPTSDCSVPARVVINDSGTLGLIILTSSGIMQAYGDMFGNGFGTGANNGVNGIYISYF